MHDGLKGGCIGALLLTAVWLLYPKADEAHREEGAVEIHYMVPEGPIKDALEEAVREFEFISRRRHEQTGGAYPVYKVVGGQHASRNQVEDPTRFLLSLAGGSPPDLIFFDRYAISEWASRGAFEPLDPYLTEDTSAWDAWMQERTLDTSALPPWPGALAEAPRAQGARPLAAVKPVRQEDFYTACWDEVVYTDPLTGNSGVYGVPSNADNRVLLYNKDTLVRFGFVDEHGEARPPTTWEELETMAVAMTEKDEKGILRRVGFIPNYGNSWLVLYGWQNGGRFMSEDGRTCTLNDPKIVDALEYVTGVYDKLGGAKQVNSFQDTFQGGALDPFIIGKVAMKIDGVWIMSDLARFGRDLNVGAAPAPMPRAELEAGRRPISWLAGWAYAIPSTAQEKRGAWELARFLASKRALEIMMATEKYTYLAQGRPFIPRQYPNIEQNEWVYREFVQNNPYLEDKFKQVMRTFNDLLPHSEYRPVTPVGMKLWNAQLYAMEEAIHHKREPQAALDYHTAEVQRALDTVLYPPEGVTIRSWTWFFVLYVLLVIGVIAWIYRRDTRSPTEPKKKLALVRLFAGDEDDAGPAVIEGQKGSYFRAQWKEGVLCALPWIVGFLVFTGGPLLFSMIISFCRYDILNPAEFTGLRNYIHMLTGDNLFWKSLYNTLFMVIGIPLGMAVGLGMAILLTLKVRGVAVWRTFFYLPSIVPMVAASILWIWIFNPSSGLLNALLESVGLTGPLWLQDEHTSKWALIIMGLWTAGGGMIIWIAGIKGISESYYEAASIDGANAWQKFTSITLPMLTPYIFFNLIMGLIGTFQIFTQAFIMTSGGPVNSTLFYVYHLFNNAFRYLNMGYACSMAWFLFLIVMLLTVWQMRLSKKWVHYEGE